MVVLNSITTSIPKFQIIGIQDFTYMGMCATCKWTTMGMALWMYLQEAKSTWWIAGNMPILIQAGCPTLPCIISMTQEKQGNSRLFLPQLSGRVRIRPTNWMLLLSSVIYGRICHIRVWAFRQTISSMNRILILDSISMIFLRRRSILMLYSSPLLAIPITPLPQGLIASLILLPSV